MKAGANGDSPAFDTAQPDPLAATEPCDVPPLDKDDINDDEGQEPDAL